MRLTGILLVMVMMAASGCYRHSEEAEFPKGTLPGSTSCDTSHVSYSTTVSKIFSEHCTLPGCHASSSSSGGYTLDSYTGVRSVVSAGRIIGAINHASGYAHMPKDRAKLNECQIGLISSWINQGAQNN